MASDRIRAFVLAASALAALACRADGEWYAQGAAQIALPQGGASMRRLGGGAARVGRYVADSLALECEAAWLEDRAGLAARAVWHLHGWREFDMLFGYERFDPFLSAGARGWLGGGQAGPSVGAGAYYYVSDDWAVRVDADATLGLDTRAEAVYAISVGLQYFF